MPVQARGLCPTSDVKVIAEQDELMCFAQEQNVLLGQGIEIIIFRLPFQHLSNYLMNLYTQDKVVNGHGWGVFHYRSTLLTWC